MFLLEGTQQRAVPRMLVGALLEADLGPARPITESELDEFDEGPPVEVLAASTGFPFVVMGGRRRPIRGYPVPLVIDDDDADRFEQGEPLRVARIAQVGPTGPRPPQPASLLSRARCPMARVIRRARSSAWWGRIEVLVVIAAALFRRLRTVGNFETIDEILWTRRVQVFSDALTNFEPSKASVTGAPNLFGGTLATMPGVPTMWLGSIGRLVWGIGRSVGRGRGEADLLREPLGPHGWPRSPWPSRRRS